MTVRNPESTCKKTVCDVLVIGAGPSGMMAAIAASRPGVKVVIAERNGKAGRKLAITGKGRCNVTNDSDIRTMESQMVSNPKFILSSLSRFDSAKTKEFFENAGVPLKVERGQRVFPVSDRAFDIVDALVGACRKAGVRFFYDTRILSLKKEDGLFVAEAENNCFCAAKVVLATGGMSYPSTGSTGDGYRMAESFGHSIVAPEEGLVPLNVKEAWPKRLMGLTLKNVEVWATVGGQEVFRDFGEMLFAHFGITGPVVLSASSRLQQALRKKKKTFETAGEVRFFIDLKPALTEEVLLARLERDFTKYAKRQMPGAMEDLLPKRLIPEILKLSGLAEDRRASSLTAKEKLTLVQTLKNLSCTVTGTRSMQEAIITIGGVEVKEVAPGTLQSRKTDGLYLAGELLDLDALTGGFNLQIAFSTGFTAGTSAAEAVINDRNGGES